MTTFEKVCGMIADQLQVSADSITETTRLVEDLKADSANVMVMILELETVVRHVKFQIFQFRIRHKAQRQVVIILQQHRATKSVDLLEVGACFVFAIPFYHIL